ncbi:MAG TPA: hypothetical protein EYP57_04130 [Thermodesulfobacteriaceae bacterium]|nr:hypothetical protein [Thermodesulfobacteriaceae bacterium]
MRTIEELRANRDLVNVIDWSMTPEKAVDMYLEWGAGWTRGNDFVRSGDEESVYFVVYDWEDPPQVTMLRRSAKNVEELAKIEAPGDLIRQSIEQGGRKAGVGVYALSRELKKWLCEAIDGPQLD